MDDLRKHAPARHRLPLSVGRSTSKRIAIKECSPAELLDDSVVGLVTMSDGVDRPTLELLLETVGRTVLSGAGAECAHKGSLRGPGTLAWRRNPGSEEDS